MENRKLSNNADVAMELIAYALCAFIFLCVIVMVASGALSL